MYHRHKYKGNFKRICKFNKTCSRCSSSPSYYLYIIESTAILSDSCGPNRSLASDSKPSLTKLKESFELPAPG